MYLFGALAVYGCIRGLQYHKFNDRHSPGLSGIYVSVAVSIEYNPSLSCIATLSASI